LKENLEKPTKFINEFQIVEMDQMEKRSAVLILRLKGLSKKAIHQKLVAVLQENAFSYLSVTRFRKGAISGLKWEETSSSRKDDSLDEMKRTK
jgi:hypothetical protein